MDNLLNVDPGLIIWTIIIFCIFLFGVVKFGGKSIMNGLKAREQSIANDINNAEKKNLEAQKYVKEIQEKLEQTQHEISDMLANGRKQSEIIINKAAEEADRVKNIKVQEAMREIERSKDAAIKQLRMEVAGLVVTATEKMLDVKLDQSTDLKLIESYIEKLPRN
jgi:F-type H+-transporting ATPase subunit b